MNTEKQFSDLQEKSEVPEWALRQAKNWLDKHPTVSWFLDDQEDLAKLLVEVAKNHSR